LFRKLRIRRNVFTAPLCEGLDGRQAEHEGRSTKSTSMPDINGNPDISTMSIFPHCRTREPAASAKRG
jgi:hypothetical protein